MSSAKRPAQTVIRAKAPPRSAPTPASAARGPTAVAAPARGGNGLFIFGCVIGAAALSGTMHLTGLKPPALSAVLGSAEPAVRPVPSPTPAGDFDPR